MQYKKKNEEVLIATDKIVSLESSFIESLKIKASKNARKRIRFCAHKDVNNKLHEMFIIHTKDTYVRPHKHVHKTESLHILEGSALLFLFDEKGRVTTRITLGDYKSGNEFYFRIDHPTYHCLVVQSDYLIFHEVTNGPWRKSNTVFAPWSPEESNRATVHEYLKVLRSKA